MKKILFILGLTTLLLSFAKTQAQTFKYLDSTCEWRYLYTGGGWSSNLITKYFDGDTTVLGNRYFRVCVAIASTAQPTTNIYYKSHLYFLGEDSNHNFIVPDFSTNPPTIKTLYYFDSIKIQNIGATLPKINLFYPKTCGFGSCMDALDGYFSDTVYSYLNHIKRKDTFLLGSIQLIGVSNSSSLGNLCFGGYQGIIEGVGSVCPYFSGGIRCSDANTARLHYFDKGNNRLSICTNPTNFMQYYNFPIPLRGLNHFCSTIVLPLKLISFTAKKENNKVLLNWQTANEVNVSHFNIQHSVDGKDFINFGKVNASCCVYRFADDIRNLELGIRNLYYRLEIIDKDGSKSYSTIQQINTKPQTPNIVIFPNPAKDVVNISCVGAKQLLIIDYLGKTVKQFNNTTNELQTLNTKQLQKGIYIVKAIMNNEEIKTDKLLIE